MLDRAGKEYWDDLWGTEDVVERVSPRGGRLSNHVNHCFHTLFSKMFSDKDNRGKRLLEVGCARSEWLPYFAREFGFEVCGIDYSEIGCRQSRQVLSKEGMKAEVVCGDFFSPPEHLIEAFDVVVSFGVAEHFEDTSGCIRAFSRFLKPGGLLLTNVPNLVGLNGLIQKIVDRAVFDVHLSLNKDALIEAHEKNGLETIFCGYFLFFHLGVLRFENWKGSMFYSGACRVRTLINLFVWTCERAIPVLKANRWSSPYINCLAFKPR